MGITTRSPSHRARSILPALASLAIGAVVGLGCSRDEPDPVGGARVPGRVVDGEPQRGPSPRSPHVSGEPLQLVTFDIAPFEYVEDGHVKGINVDIAREVFRRMGQPIEIEVLPFNRGLDRVRTGEADGMIGAYLTPEREEFAEYPSEPTAVQHEVLIVLKSSPIRFDGDLRKLSELRFGFVREFSYGPLFDSAVRDGVIRKIDNADTEEMNVRKLLGGRFDILVTERGSALHCLRALGARDRVRMLDPPLQENPAYVIFSKARGLGAVAARFDLELTQLKREPAYAELIARYLQ